MTFYLRATGFLAFIFIEFHSVAQSSNKLLLHAEAGVGVSVGKNKFASKVLTAPNSTLEYSSHKRYRLPVLRVRGEACYPLLPKLSAGLRTGADVSYFEANSYGEYETYFSPVLQSVAHYRLLNFDKSSSLLLSGAWGWKFRKQNYSPFYQRGGALWSVELSRQANRKGAMYYKIGFEQAAENWKFRYSSMWGEELEIPYRQLRRVAYASVGWSF